LSIFSHVRGAYIPEVPVITVDHDVSMFSFYIHLLFVRPSVRNHLLWIGVPHDTSRYVQQQTTLYVVYVMC